MEEIERGSQFGGNALFSRPVRDGGRNAPRHAKYTTTDQPQKSDRQHCLRNTHYAIRFPQVGAFFYVQHILALGR